MGTKKEHKDIMNYIQSEDFQEKDLLLKVILDVNPGIARSLYISLVYNISFDELYKRECLPYPRTHFYEYRRKVIDLYMKRSESDYIKAYMAQIEA